MPSKALKELLPSPDNLLSITQQKLDEVIFRHKRFMESKKGGIRAVLKFYDLSGLSMKGADLSHVDFTGSNLDGADLSHGIFDFACFFASRLNNAALEYSSFARSDFRGVTAISANAAGADMSFADMRKGRIMEINEDGGLTNRKIRDRSQEFLGNAIFTGSVFSGANLSGIKAKSADFSDTNLSGTTFHEAVLTNTSFTRANLTDADFTDADLSGTSFNDAIMCGVLLDRAEVKNTDFTGIIDDNMAGIQIETLTTTMDDLLSLHRQWLLSRGKEGKRLDISNADMRIIPGLSSLQLTAINGRNANFVGQCLNDIKMQAAILDNADFRDCSIMDADLRGASFKCAKFSRCDLSGSDMSALKIAANDGSKKLKRVDLSGAKLDYANLRDVDLQNAILMGADLRGANLEGCNLTGADLTGARFD